MPISPERNLPIERRPEEIGEIPEYIEKAGVKARQSQFKAQVKHRGKSLIQTPQAKTVTITLPTDPKTLAFWSKGKVINSLTWLGLFWLRMIKKAMHFGWKVVRKSQ